jgi:hypothetical protein
MAIAASAQGLALQATRRTDAPVGRPVFNVCFAPDARVKPDPLIASIDKRSVQRRPMGTRRLTAHEKQALEAAAAPHCRVVWREDFARRLASARLLSDFAKVRLTLPEAYPTHRDVIEWNARFSVDRVPDQALGVDRMTAKVMRFVLGSWERVRFFNRYLAGTVAPRIQMDLIPGLACAAHFALVARQEPTSIDDYVAAGRTVQRFWLTVTQLGLNLQPAVTPLIFARYLREQRPFTAQAAVAADATQAVKRLEAMLGATALQATVFMGRVGAGPMAVSRSVRLPLERLAAAEGAGVGTSTRVREPAQVS